jgi:RHS repeat-associated protein
LLRSAAARPRTLRRTLILTFGGLVAALAVASGGIGAPSNTGMPTASGSFQDGGTVAASTGAWSAGGDVEYGYQWQRCASYAPAVAADTPTGYWRMDDQQVAVGTQTLADSSGNGNTGTLTSTTLGKPGALTGDPDTSVGFYINAGDQNWATLPGSYPTGRAATTLEAWVKPNVLAGQTSVIGYGDATLNSGHQLFLGTNGTSAELRYAGSTSSNILDGGTLAVGTWYHLAASDDGTTLRLYVNGVQVNSVAAGSFQKATGQAQIGRFQPGAESGTWFRGWIDEAAIYSAAVSTTRLLAHYQAGSVATGVGCADISGATDPQYVLQHADVGQHVGVKVTATDSTGSTTAASAATFVTASGPVNTARPVVFGTPELGQALTGTEGSWDGIAFSTPPTYQWQRCGYQAAVLGKSPLSYFRLGEPAGTSASDIGSLGLAGTYVGQPGLGKAGALNQDPSTAVKLNGSSQYVTLPGAYPTGRSPATIEAWVKGTGYVGGYSDSTVNDKHGFSLYVGSTARIDSNGGTGVTGTAAIPSGQWSHVVAVDDGTVVRLYVNGKADGTWTPTTGAGAWSKANGSAQIGDFAVLDAAGTARFNGLIDEFAIYPTALSASQVSDDYQAGLQETAGVGCTDIAGATGPFDPTQTASYTVTSADTGAKLRLKVLALNGDSNGVPTEADSDAVTVTTAGPVSAGAPSISGSTAQGATLTASSGDWAGTQPISYAYQWNTCAYVPTVLGNSPAGYWRLGDDSSQLLAVDSSGHNNLGTLVPNGSGTTDGTFGASGALVGDGDSAADFSGGAKVNVPDSSSLDPTTGYSVETWLRPLSTTPASNAYVATKSTSSGGWSLAVGTGTAGTLTWTVALPSSGTSALSSGVVLNNPSHWYHVVATAGGGTQALYVDGAQVTKSYSGALQQAAGQKLSIGSPAFQQDEVAYYPVALTSTQAGALQSAAACQAITGQTSATHTVASADAGKRLSVTVTATNLNGAATASASSQTKAITGNALPENTVKPAVTGDWTVGSSVTADSGTWNSPTSLSYAYQWQRCTYGATVLGDHPAAYWPLDEIGGPTVSDLSGNNQTGTSSSVSFGLDGGLADTAESGARIGGVGSGISVGDSSTTDLGNTFTLEAWLRDPNTGSTQVIFDKGRYTNSFSTTYYGYKLAIVAGKLQLSDDNGSVIETATQSFPTDGAYHHLVATDDGAGHVKLYQDNVDVSGTPTGTTVSDVTSALGIGMTSVMSAANVQTLTNGLTGDLDELAIYPSALSTSQVAAHWNASRTPCSNISGATTNAYTVASGDIGSQVRVKVTATNTAGSASAASTGTYLATSAGSNGLEPVDGATAPTLTPGLSMPLKSGTNDYQFQIGEDASFTTAVEDAGATVYPETSNWTTNTNTFSVPGGWRLHDGKTYYWRARTRSNGVVSAWMGPNKLTTVLSKLGGGPSMWSSGPLQVNLVTGNLVFAPPTPSYPTVAGPMAMTLSYNSLDAQQHGLGAGWLTQGGPAYSRPGTFTLLSGTSGSEVVQVTFPDGSTEVFSQIGGSTDFTAPPGSSDKLVKGPGGNYQLSESDGQSYGTGTVNGATGDAPLISSENTESKPGASTFGYTRNGTSLTQITDPSGRSLSFNWTGFGASCSGGVLCVSGPDGVTWTFAENAGGQLSSINDGTRVLYAFTYDGNGRLSKIQNANDLDPTHASAGYNATHSIQIGYDGSGRVSSITEGPVTGQTPSTATTSFDYHPGDIQTDGTRDAHTLPPDGYLWDPGYTGQSTSQPVGTTRTAAGYTNVTTPLQQGSGHATRTYFDGLDRPIETIDALGNISETGFDSKSHQIWTEDAAGNATDNTFDQTTDQLLTSKDALGGIRKSYYDEQAIGSSANKGPVMQGLRGDYSPAVPNKDRPDATRTDPTINFTWGSTGPAILPGSNADFSVTWSGLLYAPTTGAYAFSSVANGFTSLTLDNLVGIAKTTVTTLTTTTSQPIVLKQGWHRISYKYWAPTGTAQVKLMWRCSSCGISNQVIPSNRLAPSYGLQTSTVSPAGRVQFSHYADPGAGHADYALQKVNGQNLITTQSYDSLGRVIRAVSPRGNASRTIDANGNLSGQANMSYATTSTYYGTSTTAPPPAFCGGGTAAHQSGQLASTSVPGLATTAYVYDGAGRKIATTNGAGTTCTTYTAEGRVSGVKDANGHTTTSTYDPFGNTLTVTTADGAVSSTKYDEANRVLSKTDALSHTTSYTHDAAGDVTQTTEPTGATTSSTFDAAGQKAADTDELLHTTTYVNDALGHRVSTTTPLLHVSSTTYDPLGRAATTTDGRGKITRYAYDGDGNQLTVTDPLNNVTTSTYDNAGRLATKTDANNHTTTYGYDLDGNQTTITAPDTGVMTYTFNAAGKTTSISDPLNNMTTYGYDSAGRLTRKTDPLNHVTRHSYDAVGNETKIVAADGTTTTKGYDLVNRLTSIHYSDSTPSATFTYDGLGNRLTMVDGAGTETYGYDAMNRLTSVTRGTSGFSYTYDSAANILSRTYPDGTLTTYTYDSDNKMATLASGGATTGYSYDATGNLTTTAFPNGWTESRSYDDAERIIDIHSTKGSQTIGAAGYTRDGAGNPTTIVRDGVAENYAYDVSDRLTAVCYGAAIASCAPSQLITYSYDKADNRLSQNRFGTTTTYTYDASGALTQTTSGTTTTYTYDQRGNQTAAGEAAFTWDAANHLTLAAQSGATIASYVYDGLGDRVTRVAGGVTTAYSWDKNSDLPMLAVQDDAGGNHRDYVFGTSPGVSRGTCSQCRVTPIGLATAGNRYYLIEDAVGSVVAVTDDAGSVAAAYTYEPYGSFRTNSINDQSLVGDALAFTGQYRDSITSMYDLRAREYDPATGRFMSPDPLEYRGASLIVANYVYTNDRPLVLIDPSGEDCSPEMITTIGLAASTVDSAGWVRLTLHQQGVAKISLSDIKFVFRGTQFSLYKNRGAAVTNDPTADGVDIPDNSHLTSTVDKPNPNTYFFSTLWARVLNYRGRFAFSWAAALCTGGIINDPGYATGKPGVGKVVHPTKSIRSENGAGTRYVDIRR